MGVEEERVELERLEVLNERSESDEGLCRKLQDFAELA